MKGSFRNQGKCTALRAFQLNCSKSMLKSKTAPRPAGFRLALVGTPENRLDHELHANLAILNTRISGILRDRSRMVNKDE